MTSRHTQQQPAKNKLATIGVVVVVGALLFAFLAPSLAVLLALVALGIGIALLVRAWRRGAAKGPAIGTTVAALVALILAGVMSPDAEQGFQRGIAPPPVDPNALPATVLVASAQSPDNLITNSGRRLHVTMMQGYGTSEPCRSGSDRATANQLVANQTVQIAAPDPARLDAPSAVPPGFQPVVLTLPDGRDYAQAWVAGAPRNALTSCAPPTTATTTATTTTTASPEPTTTVEEQPDVDVDRPYVPAPRTKARSGSSGHPCLPGERDGDKDGFCGE